MFKTLKYLSVILSILYSFVDWKTKEQGKSEMITAKTQEQGGIGLTFWLCKTVLDFLHLFFMF